jgi:hypothetical protein
MPVIHSLRNELGVAYDYGNCGLEQDLTTSVEIQRIGLKTPSAGSMSDMAILRQLRLRSVVKEKGLDSKPFGHNPGSDAATVYGLSRFLSFLELQAHAEEFSGHRLAVNHLSWFRHLIADNWRDPQPFSGL